MFKIYKVDHEKGIAEQVGGLFEDYDDAIWFADAHSDEDGFEYAILEEDEEFIWA